MTDAPLNDRELTALLAYELGRRAAFEPEWHDPIREAFLQACRLVRETVLAGRTLFICGNGGSAAQAQHLAAELVGRFKRERRGLPAIALTTDTSVLTALGNDYGYETVFRRQAESLMREGDLLLGLSTSGNSPNVVEAVKWARAQGHATVAMTGEGGGELNEAAACCIPIPSHDTDLIQERHLVLIHILAEVAERAITTAS